MIWNMWLVQDGQQIQIKAGATFLIIFGAHMHTLFIHYQSEDSHVQLSDFSFSFMWIEGWAGSRIHLQSEGVDLHNHQGRAYFFDTEEYHSL